MESYSAMSRFRTRGEIGVTRHTNGCAYIKVLKIKRIINDELTQEKFDEIRHMFYSSKTWVKLDVFIDKLIIKLNTLPLFVLDHIMNMRYIGGITPLIEVLRSPLSKLMKLETPKEVKELQDLWICKTK